MLPWLPMHVPELVMMPEHQSAWAMVGYISSVDSGTRVRVGSSLSISIKSFTFIFVPRLLPGNNAPRAFSVARRREAWSSFNDKNLKRCFVIF